MEIVKSEVLPLADVTNYGKIFAESGMFENVKSQAQAVVRILAGQEIGIPPFAAISGIHIIKGKPSMGAGLMASRVKGSGKYDYKVKEHTEKICVIEFFQKYEKWESIGVSSFSIEDAKKAQTQNLDKFPRNMLFARAISNGIKWYTPDIFAGPVYVPEEMTQITEDVPAEVTTWSPSREELQELSDLVDNSTMEDKRKEAARIAITDCKTEKDIAKIKAALLKSQPNV